MEMNFLKGFIALSLVTLLVLIGTYWYQKAETSAADMTAEQGANPAVLDFAAEDGSIHELDASAAEEEAGQSGEAGSEVNAETSRQGNTEMVTGSTADSSEKSADLGKAAASDRTNNSGDNAGDTVEAAVASEGKAEAGNGAESLEVSPENTSGSQIGESFLKNYLGMTYEDLIKTAGKPDQQTEKDFVQLLYYDDVDIMGMTGRITVKLSNGKVRDASWYVNKGKASDYKNELKKLTEYLNDQYLQSETYQWVVDSFEWVGLDGIDTNEKLGIVFY